jgi:D-alanyl-lipoteichoic acid acyltransferase DltB (MBOAT superfamily)
MAIGISKLFGIELSRNFRSPFFATSIREYWQRWHITLTLWMMKYVFTPLAFFLKKFKKTGLIIAVIITFTLVGLWHGANWTFVIFGFLHGLYFIPLIVFNKNPAATTGQLQQSNSLRSGEWLKSVGLFILVMFTAVFFASSSVDQAINYFKRIFSASLLSPPVLPPLTGVFKVVSLLFFILLMFIIEWLQKNRSHELELDHLKRPIVRRIIYLVLIAAILLFGSVSQINFFYAQF